MTEVTFDPDRMAKVKTMARSVSQTRSYLEELGGCRYAYFLKRVVKAWDKPAAWFPQGLAVHEAAEFWEKSNRTATLAEVEQVYKESYIKHTRRLLKGTPNPDFWYSSGPYRGQADILRRAEKGLEQIKAYVNYYTNQKPGDLVWITPDGTPAIELGFSTTFGSVTVRGYIDSIMAEILTDLKTGKKPGDIFQLSTYRFGVLDMYGIDFVKGQYYMANLKSRPTKVFDLTTMGREQVTEYYETMDAGVKAEDFAPSPSEDKCYFCNVSSACAYKK